MIQYSQQEGTAGRFPSEPRPGTLLRAGSERKGRRSWKNGLANFLQAHFDKRGAKLPQNRSKTSQKFSSAKSLFYKNQGIPRKRLMDSFDNGVFAPSCKFQSAEICRIPAFRRLKSARFVPVVSGSNIDWRFQQASEGCAVQTGGFGKMPRQAGLYRHKHSLRQ